MFESIEKAEYHASLMDARDIQKYCLHTDLITKEVVRKGSRITKYECVNCGKSIVPKGYHIRSS